MTKTLQPGIYPDMPNNEYHADVSAISKSKLDLVAKSPAHYRYALDHPQNNFDSDTLMKGRAFHSMLLDDNPAFAVWEGKVRRGKAWDEFQAEHGGLDIITATQMGDIDAMVTAVRDHPIAMDLLASSRSEVSAVAEINGVLCKARADCLVHSGPLAGCMADLKTTRDASPNGFYKSVEQYRYDVQASFYPEVFRRAGADVNGTFYFITVESSTPNLVQVYELDLDILEAGERAYLKDLEKLKQCRDSGNWPGYAGINPFLLEARPYGRMAPVNNLTWNGEEVVL